MANPDRNLLFPNLTTNPIYEEADHSRPNGPLPLPQTHLYWKDRSPLIRRKIIPTVTRL